MADPRGSRPPVRVALLGSGGSIGTQAVDVLAALAPNWEVVAIATGSQAALLEEQVRRLRPRLAAIGSDVPLDLPAGCAQVRGPGALEALATAADVDLVVVATGGVVSLRPVLAALRAGKVVATANKETLVAGRPPRDGGGREHGPPSGRPSTLAIPWPRRWAGCGRSTRSTRRSGSASPGR